MARVLKDEATLARRRDGLARENRVLQIVNYAEWPLAAVLLIAGVIVYATRGSAGLLIAGGIAAFLCAGHYVKIRENTRQHAIIGAGRRGEIRVTDLLEDALGDDTYILNDVLIRHARKSAQIDHLVVCPKGLFVIETKNWRGAIRGDEQEPQWTQVREAGGRPVRVSNPVMQNARHIAVLRAVLAAAGVEWPDILSLVVYLSEGTEFDITRQTVPILTAHSAARFVADYQPARTYDTAAVDKVLNLLMAGGRS